MVYYWVSGKEIDRNWILQRVFWFYFFVYESHSDIFAQLEL